MHTQPMSESQGTFQGPKARTGELCRHCKTETMVEELWESSDGAYEDYKITCSTCKHGYWEEGIDS